MPKLVIVPTSHIAAESMKHIRDAIEKEKPDCVAIELDEMRYKALKEEKKGSTMEAIKAMGLPTFVIFSLLKRMQQKLGGMVGIMPGSDMLTAIEEAEKRSITVAFIDQDIRVTAWKFKKDVTFREKFRMFSYVIQAGVILSVGPHLPKKKGIKIKGKTVDLTKVPEKEFIEIGLEMFFEKFPNLYRILLTERNAVMAKNLLTLAMRYETVVAVIGAGHEKGIKEALEEHVRKHNELIEGKKDDIDKESIESNA
jgi:pheromone shutdown protein TraB